MITFNTSFLPQNKLCEFLNKHTQIQKVQIGFRNGIVNAINTRLKG